MLVEPFTGQTVAKNAAFVDAPTREERASAARLAQALAAAVEDANARRYLFDAFAATDNRERKLHLSSFMGRRGATLLDAAERKAKIPGKEVLAAIGAVRQLELYMPVLGHRGRWTADIVPLIVVALSKDDKPIAYDALGNATVLSRDFAPIRPVIVAVPLETDLRPQIARNGNGHAETPCSTWSQETLETAWERCHRRSASAASTQYSTQGLDGLYLEFIELYGNQCGSECWWAGDPEYEIHVRHPGANANIGESKQCVANNPATERQPGIRSLDYKWDMNGNAWAGRAKLLNGPQLDVANTSGFTLEVWEDDIYACELSANAFNLQSKTAFLMGFGWAMAGIVLEVPSLAILGTAVLFVGLTTNHFSGDDFVGGIAKPQGQFTATATTNMVLLRDNSLKGRAFIKAYDATPPAPGATANVIVSGASAGLLPIGGMSFFTASAIDANGVGAPERQASWSSSNTELAGVDAYGWVSGHALGDVMITATIDGISRSVLVSVVPPDGITLNSRRDAGTSMRDPRE